MGWLRSLPANERRALLRFPQSWHLMVVGTMRHFGLDKNVPGLFCSLVALGGHLGEIRRVDATGAYPFPRFGIISRKPSLAIGLKQEVNRYMAFLTWYSPRAFRSLPSISL